MKHILTSLPFISKIMFYKNEGLDIILTIYRRGVKRKAYSSIFAAWVNWHRKVKKLEFYHDEEDPIIRPIMPLKRRKPKY